jgi:hypothetical protein
MPSSLIATIPGGGALISQPSEGPLAEFAALRQELLYRAGNQSQLMSLQLTATGVVLGISATQDGARRLALLIPLISYSLYSRYIDDALGIITISTYIRDDLTGRVPGGLLWEEWLRTNVRLRSIHSRLSRAALFPGSSIVALVWSYDFVFGSSRIDGIARFGIIALWALGLLGAVLHAYDITRGRFGKHRQPVHRDPEPRHDDPGAS